MHPWSIDELQCPISQRNDLFIVHCNEPVLWNREQINEHPFTFGCRNDLCLRVFLQDFGESTRMVLLRMVGNNIIYVLHPKLVQVGYQHTLHSGIYRINKGSLFAALN